MPLTYYQGVLVLWDIITSLPSDHVFAEINNEGTNTSWVTYLCIFLCASVFVFRWRTSWRFSPRPCFLSPCWGKGWASTSGSRCSSSWPESRSCRYRACSGWAAVLPGRFEVFCHLAHMCVWFFFCFVFFNPHSGPRGAQPTLRRRSRLPAPSLWGWWPCWWRACPAALRGFTLRRSSRRPSRACGSVTYSWVSEAVEFPALCDKRGDLIQRFSFCCLRWSVGVCDLIFIVEVYMFDLCEFILKGHFPLSEKEDSRVYFKYIPIKGVCVCVCNDGVPNMEQLTGAVEERRVWLHLWVCGDLSLWTVVWVRAWRLCCAKFYIPLNLLFKVAVTWNTATSCGCPLQTLLKDSVLVLLWSSFLEAHKKKYLTLFIILFVCASSRYV